MQQTSWLLRPVMPLMLLPYLLLITTPSTGISYDFRETRQKRSPGNGYTGGQTQLGDASKTSTAYERKVKDIFIVGDGSGIVLFNDTSQPIFKVQRSPDGKLNVVFNELIFQTTTSATPTGNNNNNNSYDFNKNMPTYSSADKRIVFPDDEYVCDEQRQGKTYCTEVPNYLEISKLDRVSPDKFAKFKSYFRDDLLQPQNVTQRMNSDPTEEFYCSSSSRLVYPKSAETKESKWLLVVQTPEHKQGILVEQCENEDKPCKFEELLPSGYTSLCRQNSVYRTMVVLVNGEMKEEQVKMPNCCKCVLKRG